MSSSSNSSREGYLRFKGTNNYWASRFFVLKGGVLYNYVHNTHTESKSKLYLHKNCKVSDAPIEENNRTHGKLYVFCITWPAEKEGKDTAGNAKSVDKGGDKQSPSANNAAGDNSYYNYFFGSNSKKDSNDNSRNTKDDSDRRYFAASEEHDAHKWIEAINSQISALKNNGMFSPIVRGSGGGIGTNKYKFSNNSSSNNNSSSAGSNVTRIREVNEWLRNTKWVMNGVHDGIRIYRQNRKFDSDVNSQVSNNNHNNGNANAIENSSCFRVNLSLNASPSETLKTVLNMPSFCRNGPISEVTVIESSKTDPYVDVIHVVCNPQYIYPIMTSPRDMCLLRYWKQVSDGIYIICLDSTYHQDCPVMPGYVRAEMHAAYVIAPPKESPQDDVEEYDTDQGSVNGVDGSGDYDECLLSFVCQMDAKGWLWKQFGYQDELLKNFMTHVLDIRDCVDLNRFSNFALDPFYEEELMSVNVENKNAKPTAEGDSKDPTIGVDDGGDPNMCNLGKMPAPLCPSNMYAEPDGTSFQLRGPTYLSSRKKKASEPNLFKFLCIDLFKTKDAQHNICSHVNNRVYQALQRGENTWVFVLNIMVPGPQPISFVVYWEGSKDIIHADTAFGRIARPFFEGTDDDFRNQRFKMIPRIMDGGLIMRFLVTGKPTLLGTKLKQYYYRGKYCRFIPLFHSNGITFKSSCSPSSFTFSRVYNTYVSSL